MRAPLSWVREYADLPAAADAADVAARLTARGLKLESLEAPGSDIVGPLVVGRVLGYDTEQHSNGKTVRWVAVDVGKQRGIVCGATNFAVGDLVPVALPGSVLPGGFAISARTAYGHLSDGMICSPRELGLGDDSAGVLVLEPGSAAPGSDAVKLLGLRDDVLELEITPDRGYALSLRGVAREAAGAYRVDFRDPAQVRLSEPVGAAYPVRVHDCEGCPRFVTRVVTGLDATASTPGWMARRVQLAGMRPISLVVDVTNYVMLELGQPIHAYDRALLSGAIDVRRARPGEPLRTLDGVARVLDAEDLVISDERGAIGLAGVMGGEPTEISAGTREVVIEAANFDPVSVGRTARRHRLGSEASRRFERGVDPQLVRVAVQRVADLLVAHGHGRLEPGETDLGKVEAPETIVMAADLPGSLRGHPIETRATVAALREVGCEVRAQADLAVTPPSWRPDLRDPYDLVEEVLRIIGYDTVPSVLPRAPAGGGLTKSQRLRRRVGYALAGAGLTEVVAYPFVGPADWGGLGLARDDERRRCVRLANPPSQERPMLTTTLAPLLLDVTARNVGRGQASLGLSLVAAVFEPGPDRRPPPPVLPVDVAPSAEEMAALDAGLPNQPRHLAVALCGDREPPGWWGPARPACWADAVAIVVQVARTVGVEVAVGSGAVPPWHPGRGARILLGDVCLGHAGELHPSVCRSWGVPPRTCYAEVDLDALIAAAPTTAAAPVLSAMPVAKEDVALVVGDDVPAAAVAEALRRGAGDLLESLRLFDVYTGPPVPPGYRSLAFALRLRAADRTLTEPEARAVREAAVRAAAAATGARLRD